MIGDMNDMAIQQSTNERLRELALFAGAGGGILGGKLLGWRTVCAVERDAYASQVLAQRQNDGILEPFPIWSDITTFDGKPWRGIVDVVSGGFPCQDISAAGKGAGIEGARSGLWKEVNRIVCEIEPIYVYLENSPMLTIRGLGTVLADLSKIGFDAEWGTLSCGQLAGLHQRERIWLLATNSNRKHKERNIEKKVFRLKRLPSIAHDGVDKNERGLRSIFQPGLCRSFNGIPDQMDRLKSIGNAQVPGVAATAFELLRERLEND